MNLHSDYPFWLIQNGLTASYPALTENKKSDIAIIGAGITGALVGYHLTKAGYEVTLVDKRHAAMGSTAASTALLQYEIDLPLVKLAQKRGLQDAVKSYQLCLDAIDKAGDIASEVHTTSFEKKISMQYASYNKDVEQLQAEYQLRKQHKFPVEWLEEKEIKEKFYLQSKGAILSSKGAQVDPYLFTHDLLKYITTKGGSVYDTTNITTIRHKKNHIELKTDKGYTITAKYLVMAAGYESGKYLPKQVEELSSTYAIISKPFPDKELWYKNALIWETADPYNYMRTTHDNRIVMGGKDDEFADYERREGRLKRKSAALLASFGKLIPNIPFVTDFAWTGIFGSTKDGLPYIGSVKEMKNTFFTLGYGGNGIIFSVIAGQTIADTISGKKNEAIDLFSFYR